MQVERHEKLVVGEEGVVAAEMTPEVRVVVEPPEGRLREDDERCPLRAQALDLGDRGVVIGRRAPVFTVAPEKRHSAGGRGSTERSVVDEDEGLAADESSDLVDRSDDVPDPFPRASSVRKRRTGVPV